MTSHLSEELFANLSFEGVSGPERDDCWCDVSGFLDEIKEHRKAFVVLSERICVHDRILRWYGLGGECMSIGLHQYVAVERKAENGGELKAAF